ncbi:MAG TPA: adenosylmethionine--8-amino-7-oxononanoate transaminase [Candidatus Dormibacteraeota bacterium]|nr:adenosylmethionine--8-amino-7-oxononanoate transaminase [Candidatus Dormibacteraeota bacterium]
MTARMLGVVGTDTDAGKTVVAALVAAGLRGRGLRVGAVKPVATGVAPGSPGADAALLGLATGAPAAACALEELALPRSPLAAAAAEGRSVDVDALEQEIVRRAEDGGLDLLVVEGVGGVLVPLTPRCTVRDLMRRLGAPVLVAGRAGLGTINHCALTVDACRSAGLEVVGVVLSDVAGGVDPGLAAENAAQVAAQCPVPVLGVLPHLAAADLGDAAGLAAAAERHLDLGALLARLGEPGRRAEEAETAEVVRLDRAHAWHPFTQTSEWLDEEPLVIRDGAGCRVRDARGRVYIDGISSLWANVHGHAHPRLDAALREQSGRIAHSTFLGQTHAPGARLAAELAAAAPGPLTRVFYSEAGAAAVEVGLRVALLAQRRRGEPRRTRFLSLEDGYHGDTAGAVSVGRSEPFHRGLDPLLFDAVRVPPPQLVRARRGGSADAAERESLAAMRLAVAETGDRLAAVVVEPRVQGAAGIWPHSDAWLRAVAAEARACGALLLCDEVATGFGRTGDLFACGGAGVEPDILTLGKGLGGGYLPLSATLVGDALFDLFTGPHAEHRTLYYGHTFTANPLACAVARASLALFDEEDTLARARALGRRVGERLEEVADLPGVTEVRRRGVMAGIELGGGRLDHPFDPALRVGRQVILAARRRGVIVRPLGDVVVLNPPLVMTDAEADLMIEAVAESIVEVVSRLGALPGVRW